MQPLLKFPDNKTESKKEECKKKLLKIKKTLKTKCNFTVAEAQKAYELFCVASLSARRKHNGT